MIALKYAHQGKHGRRGWAIILGIANPKDPVSPFFYADTNGGARIFHLLCVQGIEVDNARGLEFIFLSLRLSFIIERKHNNPMEDLMKSLMESKLRRN